MENTIWTTRSILESEVAFLSNNVPNEWFYNRNQTAKAMVMQINRCKSNDLQPFALRLYGETIARVDATCSGEAIAKLALLYKLDPIALTNAVRVCFLEDVCNVIVDIVLPPRGWTEA